MIHRKPVVASDWIKIEPGKDNGQAYVKAVMSLPRAQRRAINRQARLALKKYRKTKHQPTVQEQTDSSSD
jgi:hypothetical protein